MSGQSHYNYYWREYAGEIPFDAVTGGTDVDNKTTYISQVNLNEYGIIPVTIYPGEKICNSKYDGIT
ncbi:hypothetical protein NQ314_018864 [Rhamnusium bicolor]|uniref:Uncharacterized protein n=1 Tax=Rhamnusium bicolor TaxID=1586634 RepID=A0AAV8WQG8_9CUCU|nr:hypothetical protein NQ314_018864 [Rhamnusium bicolor]